MFNCSKAHLAFQQEIRIDQPKPTEIHTNNNNNNKFRKPETQSTNQITKILKIKTIVSRTEFAHKLNNVCFIVVSIPSLKIKTQQNRHGNWIWFIVCLFFLIIFFIYSLRHKNTRYAKSIINFSILCFICFRYHI